MLGIWPDTPTVDDRQIIRFMIASGSGALLWWAAIATTGRYLRSSGVVSDRLSFGLMLLAAIGARIAFLIIAPEATVLSDDVFRYMWDGRVVDTGINPLTYAPDDPILTPLRDAVFYPHINHSHLPTIYPPLSQYFFWVAYKLTPESIVGFKIVSLIMEMIAWGIAWWYMTVRQINRHHLVVLAWCPLMIWEFVYSAHLDMLALPMLVLALTLLAKDRPVVASAILAAAGTIKFVGWLFLPLCFWQMSARTKMYAIAAASATMVVLYYPFITAEEKIFGSLGTYLEQWRFNGSLYQLAALIFDDPDWLRWVLGGLFALWWIVATRLRQSVEDRWLAIWLGFVVFTTTLFPWYMLWVMPALLWRRWAPMLWLVGTVLMSYQYLIDYELTSRWADTTLSMIIQYGGFYPLLGWWAWRLWSNRRSENAVVTL